MAYPDMDDVVLRPHDEVRRFSFQASRSADVRRKSSTYGAAEAPAHETGLPPKGFRREGRKRQALQDLGNVAASRPPEPGRHAGKGPENSLPLQPTRQCSFSNEQKRFGQGVESSELLTNARLLQARGRIDNFGKENAGALHLSQSKRFEKCGIADIDEPFREDPQMVTEYAATIFKNLLISERKHRPSPHYLETVQKDLTMRMRAVLIDWLVEVAEEYRLTSDTLFLSVVLIDRFLSVRKVCRNQLQLVGITCMMVAAKYEEIYVPQIKDFCYITDFTYSKEEVLDMERDVLGVLNFELTQPTAKTFLRRFIIAADLPCPQQQQQLDALTRYLIELSLLDSGLLQYLPSQIAASAVLLALATFPGLPQPVWTPTLQHCTGYRAEELFGCARAMHSLLLTSWHLSQTQPSFLPAVRERYSTAALLQVSRTPPIEVLPASLFISL